MIDTNPARAMTSATVDRDGGTTDVADESLLADADGAPTIEDVDDALLGLTVEDEAVETVERLARTVRTEDIETAFYRSELTHLASGPSLTETTIMLLENGFAFLDLITSPLGMTIPDIPSEAAGWTQWRRDEDGGYELRHQEDDSWHPLDGVEIERGASAAEILAGNFVRRTTYRIGDTVVTRSDGLVLSADGELERRGESIVTRGGDVVLSGRVHTSSSRWSSVDELPRGEDGEPLHDRYRLLDDGLTLEVTFADGRVEYRLGYRLGTGVVLDGRAYQRGAGAARLSDPGDAGRRGGGGSGEWLAILAEAEEERRRRNGGGALDPEVIAREAAARERLVDAIAGSAVGTRASFDPSRG